MDFLTSLKVCHTKYADFEGTASRSEYWWFYLYSWLLIPFCFIPFVQILFIIIALATVIPYMAVAVRRMHDLNYSGWRILWGLIPLFGSILLIVWYAREGNINNTVSSHKYEYSHKAIEEKTKKEEKEVKGNRLDLNPINTVSKPTKPSFWRWFWFLVPWLIIVIVSLLFDPITFSPTLLIFAAIITVPRMISTYKSSYLIRRDHIQIIKYSLFGFIRSIDEIIIPFESIISIKIKKSLFGYETVFLHCSDRDEKINYLYEDSDFLYDLHKCGLKTTGIY